MRSTRRTAPLWWCRLSCSFRRTRKLLPSGSSNMTSSPGANGPLGATRALCVRSAFGERALPPKPSIDDQLSMWSAYVHRWRRPILHAIAGGAIVASGAVAIARGPSSLPASDTSPSQVEVLKEPRFESLADGAAVQGGTATVALSVQPSRGGTPDVVEDTAIGNAAAPSAPDAPLAMRTYT